MHTIACYTRKRSIQMPHPCVSSCPSNLLGLYPVWYGRPLTRWVSPILETLIRLLPILHAQQTPVAAAKVLKRPCQRAVCQTPGTPQTY
jgi:hypothetical protein